MTLFPMRVTAVAQCPKEDGTLAKAGETFTCSESWAATWCALLKPEEPTKRARPLSDKMLRPGSDK